METHDMRPFSALILVLFLTTVTLPHNVMADPTTAASTLDDSGNYGDSYGYGRGRNLGWPGIMADLFLLRPFGLVMTIGGAGLVVATSPLIGMASFAPPHDAFERTANALVIGPAGFTFNRPLGEFSYQRNGIYPILTKPIDRPIQAPVPIVTQKTVRSKPSRESALR
jgi:hypothetical protein